MNPNNRPTEPIPNPEIPPELEKWMNKQSAEVLGAFDAAGVTIKQYQKLRHYMDKVGMSLAIHLKPNAHPEPEHGVGAPETVCASQFPYDTALAHRIATFADFIMELFPETIPELEKEDSCPTEIAMRLITAMRSDIETRRYDLLQQMWQEQILLNVKTFASNPHGAQGCTDCAGKSLTFGQLLGVGLDVKDHIIQKRCWDSSDPNADNLDTVNKWVRNYTLAMRQECGELMDSTNWKWWRTKVDKFDLQNVWVELIDILHFWMSACMVAGLTPADVFKMYMQKNDVNFGRQESGYIEKDENDSKHLAPE